MVKWFGFRGGGERSIPWGEFGWGKDRMQQSVSCQTSKDGEKKGLDGSHERRLCARAPLSRVFECAGRRQRSRVKLYYFLARAPGKSALI